MARLIMRAALMAAMICGPCAVSAQTPDQTTQRLYENCKSDDPIKATECMSYLLGVAETMDIDEAAFRDAGLSASARTQLSIFALCGASYTADLLRQVFLTWSEKHPEQRTTYRWSGAATALRHAWPCQ